MKLKKINTDLQEALLVNGFELPTELQKKTFGTIKSGVDTVLVAPTEEGKTLALVIAVMQRLERQNEEEIATQALVVVKDQEAVLEMVTLFENVNAKADLRIYGVHDRTDLDNDKNMLSLGNDVLIGTIERLNLMFSGAGFDVNQLKMYVVDDLDLQLKARLEPRLYRLSESIGKTQRIYTASDLDERVDFFIDKTMNEDVSVFDFIE